MNRSTLRSFGFAVASLALTLAPHAVGAQPISSEEFTADGLRSGFINQGFRADVPTRWWTFDSVTTFRVSDPASGRELMVLVYPDSATADSERAKVQPQEADSAKRLVLGYGLSTWRGNVALAESTAEDLSRQYAAQLDRDNQTGLSGRGTAESAPA